MEALRGVLALAMLGLAALGAGAPHSNPGPEPPQAADGLKVLLFYDMEGASGVLDDASMNPAIPDAFERGRASLVSDVNAVVAGLFDGGATEVEVRNAHGNGADSLISRERLDPRAGIAPDSRGLHPYNPDSSVIDRVYHAVVTVAMHDKPLSGGFSPHTITAGISPVFDGRTVTETELVGYAYGGFGLPVIFASGDDRLRATLAVAMPWVEYVTVKQLTRPTEVEPLPAEQVRQALRKGAERALRMSREPGRMQVMRLSARFRAGLLPSYPAFLPPGMGSIPGLQRSGDTVTFVAGDYRSAYLGIFALQRIALAFRRERVLFELMGKAHLGPEVQQATDSVMARWLAFEQGKWKP